MIHAKAIVESEDIGEGTNIWAYAHVMPGARVGSNSNVADNVFIEGGAVVGSNVTLKNNVCVWDGVTIEDDVFVGPSVTFTNDRHPRSPRMDHARARYADRGWLSETRVGRGCAIGAAATICPGIELGAYSVIGAGAVVTKNVAPFSLVLGNPARKVGDVCMCGQSLDGPFDEATCLKCGQTASDRRAHLSNQHSISISSQK